MHRSTVSRSTAMNAAARGPAVSMAVWTHSASSFFFCSSPAPGFAYMVLRVVVTQPPSSTTTSTAVVNRRSATTCRPTTEERSNRPAGDRRSACGILDHARDTGEVRRLVAEIERPAVAHAAAALGHRDAGARRLDVQPHALARLEREPGPPVVGAVQVGAVRDAREVGTAP